MICFIFIVKKNLRNVFIVKIIIILIGVFLNKFLDGIEFNLLFFFKVDNFF